MFVYVYSFARKWLLLHNTLSENPIYEKKISAEVRLIHAEQISSYNFIVLRKKQLTQLKIKQVEQDILNQWESMGFSKLSYWK